MRHVNEPAPSVLERRPDAPLRLAHLVERCLEKDPAERPSMDACVAELDATLAELDAKPDGEATMIARAPRELRRPARPRRRRSLRRPVLLLLVGLLVAGVVAAAFVAFGGDESGGASNATTIRLSGVGVYDPPPGDGEEHNDLVGNATDGDLDTYWTTETYRAFTKDGVGLVLDAGRDVDLATVTVRTSTPGFTAELRAGDSPTSFPDTVAGGRTVADGTTFEVGGGKERYFLLWITSLDSVARVSEVTARAS
jgi:serine/threonine-protein kinase